MHNYNFFTIQVEIVHEIEFTLIMFFCINGKLITIQVDIVQLMESCVIMLQGKGLCMHYYWCR